MNRTALQSLAFKELYHLRPIALALLLLELLSLIEVFISKSPDTVVWSDISALLSGLSAEVATLTCVLGVTTGYLLFPHEQDGRTLKFLWALPVRRHMVFVTKAGTGFLLLAGLALLSHLDSLFVHSFDNNSITRLQFTWSNSWLELGLWIGVYAISLSYGIFMSWFRWVGILVFVILWAVTYTVATVNPTLSYVHPTALLGFETKGTRIILDATPWLLHGTLAAITFAASGVLWTRYSEKSPEPGKAGARIVGGFLILVGAVAAINFALNTIVPNFGAQPGDSKAILTTEHYELTFYRSDAARAALLHREADDYFAGVQQLLGAPLSGRIVADLTDNGEDHLGIAGWKRLRITPNALQDPNERAHVFVHESAHVLADLVADHRLTEHGAYTAFFNEGLAEWVSYESLGLAPQQHALRVLASAAWLKYDLRFSDFLFASGFQTAYDQNLIYALGEAWVSSLATTCGTDAPRDVLRAIGRQDAPQRIGGQQFWHEHLQTIGCDLSAVNSAMDQLMHETEEEALAIPDVRASVAGDASALTFTLTLPETPAQDRYRVTIRVRDNPSVPPSAQSVRSVTVQGGRPETVTMQARLSGNRFQYQVGVHFIAGERPFFGRWIDAG